MIEFIEPRWDAPANVGAAFTTRIGGVSSPPFDGFNLAQHVGDDTAAVAQNRTLLVEALNLPAEPDWINQVHGTRVVDLDRDSGRDGDAAVCREAGRVAAVLVADCLPILLCNRAGTEVAAVHAGWRGLQAGVIQAAVARMTGPPSELLAWIGPGISRAHFEVGDEVRAAFAESLPGSIGFFAPHGSGHWLCDLAAIAGQVLAGLGLASVGRDRHCSFRDRDEFFSYRRDGATGRMAGLIWIKP